MSTAPTPPTRIPVGLKELQVTEPQSRKVKEILDKIFIEYGIPIDRNDPLAALIPIIEEVMNIVQERADESLDNFRDEVQDHVGQLISQATSVITMEYQRQAAAGATAVDAGIATGKSIVATTSKRMEAQLTDAGAQIKKTVEEAAKPLEQQHVYAARIESAANRIIIVGTILTVVIAAATAVNLLAHVR
jgi:fructose-1,6-bisphosphatase